MPSIFTRIITGEIPCHKIAENDEFFAFLDSVPVTLGHTLVVPKQEIDYIFDLSEKQLANLMAFAKSISPAIERACPCKRIGISVIGLEVPHAHVHLLPINTLNDMDFHHKLHPTQAQLAEIATAIRSFL